MEKPASLSVHPLSQPLAATTSASQDHFSLICLPCSELLFLFFHLFCSLLPLSYVCILDCFLYVWLWRKCSCYSANPLASLTSFLHEFGSVKCITEHLLYGSICLSNLGISHQEANLSFDVAAVECKTLLKWFLLSNSMKTLVNCGVPLQSGALVHKAAVLICVNMFVIIMGLWLV